MKVAVESAKTQKFYQADKQAARREQPVKVSPYLGRGSAQGSLDQISDKIDKKMTIEQVREILNKDR
jgi:transaldolase